MQILFYILSLSSKANHTDLQAVKIKPSVGSRFIIPSPSLWDDTQLPLKLSVLASIVPPPAADFVNQQCKELQISFFLFINRKCKGGESESFTQIFILCLTPRTTVTSARIPDKDACHRARNLNVFSRVQKGTPGLTHKGCVLQRVSLGALSDVTGVLR